MSEHKTTIVVEGPLSQSGTLQADERAEIMDWLEQNFVDPFECEVELLEGGGVLVSDPNEEIGADDETFWFQLFSETGQEPDLLLVLFTELEQGWFRSRAQKRVVAHVIEGVLTDVDALFVQQVEVIWQQR